MGKIASKFRFAAFAGALTVALMATSSAFAIIIPTATIGGIAVPTVMAPGGNYIATQLDFEKLVTATGQTFYGIGQATSISDKNGIGTYAGFLGTGGFNIQGTSPGFAPGLYASFGGFIVDTIVAPTLTTAGTITFKNGYLKYYTFANGAPPTTGTGSSSTDQSNVQAGALWLSLLPDVIDSFGHTLIITIPQANSLSAFAHASATAALDVNLADFAPANSFFNTCPASGFTNPTGSGGCSDIDFSGSASSISTLTGWDVSGSDTVKARNSSKIPEPGSLLLLGSALLGLAGLRRKRARA